MSRVAWYDIGGKGWLRDIIIILHPPYTAWHLAYIPIGAALAPTMDWGALGWTVLAFFLGMGVAGHCLDELAGRPLKTTIPTAVLGPIAVLSVAGAVAIGVVLGLDRTLWLIPCILFGSFIVYAYNLEWPRGDYHICLRSPVNFEGSSPRTWHLLTVPEGFFHHDFWFAFAWGSFPAITAYVAQTHTISLSVVMVAIFALFYSWAQRALSLQARFWRRRVNMTEAVYYLESERPVVPGTPTTWPRYAFGQKEIIGPAEVALKIMNAGIIALSIGLLLMNAM